MFRTEKWIAWLQPVLLSFSPISSIWDSSVATHNVLLLVRCLNSLFLTVTSACDVVNLDFLRSLVFFFFNCYFLFCIYSNIFYLCWEQGKGLFPFPSILILSWQGNLKWWFILSLSLALALHLKISNIN